MLETPRLILRPMLAEDADALLQIFADPRVRAAFGVGPFARPQMERWVQRSASAALRWECNATPAWRSSRA